MATLVRINELAEKYKVSKRSIRYYEEIGLLKSTRVGASQSRYFDTYFINRLEQILLLRSVKFSVSDISQVLLSDNSDTAFKIFENRLKELDEKLGEVSYFKAVISSFLKISENLGFDNLNLYQLLRDQIYIHSNNERMVSMETSYEGDIIKFEFGTGIIPLINAKEEDNFLDKIRNMRNRFESETMRDIPLIRVLDNVDLNEMQYRISIKGKVLVDNNLSVTSSAERISEMIMYLERIIKANIEDISDQK